MFDYLDKKEENKKLEGSVFEMKWKKDDTFAKIGPISVDYIQIYDESCWDTIRNNQEIASYRTFGGDFKPFVSKCIERDGQFWHSKKPSGPRGVKIEFVQRVTVESFRFQTRQDLGMSIKFTFQFNADGRESLFKITQFYDELNKQLKTI